MVTRIIQESSRRECARVSSSFTFLTHPLSPARMRANETCVEEAGSLELRGERAMNSIALAWKSRAHRVAHRRSRGDAAVKESSVVGPQKEKLGTRLLSPRRRRFDCLQGPMH